MNRAQDFRAGRPGGTSPLAPAAVWTGIGTVGTAVLGILTFNEPATAFRLASIGLIVVGTVGLKIMT